MKKLLVFALVLAMVLAVPTAVLADAFVSSPSNVDAPTLGDVTASNKDWDGKIVVTSFADTDTAEMTAAYDSIKAAASVNALNSALPSDKELAVSTLFDVSATKEGMGTVTITLTSDKFENFVALLHFVDGKWEVVDNAKANDKTLTFSVDSLSPFAVVVSTKKSPETGSSLPVGIIAFAVLFGAAGVCFLAKSRA